MKLRSGFSVSGRDLNGCWNGVFLPTKCFIYNKEIGHLATMIKSKAEQAISSVGYNINQCLFTSKTQITIF